MLKFRKRIAGCVLAAVLAGSGASAQAPSAQLKAAEDTARLKLAPLTWLVGEWSGTATGTNGGQSFSVMQQERVTLAASGTVLLIQGQGMMNGKPVFEAAGLISYDMASHQFKWVSSGGTGYLGISNAEVRGDTLVWFTPGASGSRTRYTIWKSATGEWREIGELSRDNQSWTRTFEMTLVTK